MFSLVQLECFVTVAEELHFGAAARRLRMTQPPLSRQIQLLERELGAALFTRTSRRVTLTPAGQALLPRAQRILGLCAQTSVDVRRTAEGTMGTLVVAYMSTVAQSALPMLLHQIVSNLPDIGVTLRDMVSTDQLDELVRGTVDLGLVRPLTNRPGIRLHPIMVEPLIAAVPSGGPLGGTTAPVTIAELADQPFVMYSHGYFHDQLRHLFAAAGREPEIAQYGGQVSAILAFVQGGLGVTLVPESARHYVHENVTYRDLIPGSVPHDLAHLSICLAWNEETVHPAVLRLLALLLTDDSV